MSADWFGRAVRYREQGCMDEAIDAYRRAIAQEPGLALAHEQLGKLLYREGRADEAAGAYRDWHSIDPRHPVAAHLHAATGGAPAPSRASDEYVVDLFDRAAADFDSALAALSYRVPELLLEQVASTWRDPAGALEVLDLGCGTGLCGPMVRPWARLLIGVDLSPAMLDRARVRSVYDELHAVEVTQFLRSRRVCSVDGIVAGDVFCYFGELEPVLAPAAECLRPAGSLVFSVEELEGPDGFELLQHGRYAHTATYVEHALAHAGMVARITRTHMLRFERGAPVAGLIVSAFPREPQECGSSARSL